MRFASLLFATLLIATSVAIPSPVAAQEPEAVGSLSEVMRAILFPNSNHLFDVQSTDPGSPPAAEEGGSSATSMFSGIYKGWQVVDQAAIALAEVERLIMIPRKCDNGKPAPIDQEDYQKWAKQLSAAGKATLEASRRKDRDAVIELTNDIAIACEDCHTKYRRYEDRCRTTP